MILPGLGSLAGLGKSAPEIRGAVQSAANSHWSISTAWSPDIAAHEAGDVLVVVIGVYRPAGDTSPDLTVSSGWTVVDDNHNDDFRYVAVLRRTAVSSATTLTLTTNSSAGPEDPFSVGLVHSYACRFAEGSVGENRQIDTRNPPSLTPSWGAENNLWIAAAFGVGTAPSSSPAGFSAGTQTTASTVHLSTAELEGDAATLDPGAFEGTAATGDYSYIIAVRPE